MDTAGRLSALLLPDPGKACQSSFSISFHSPCEHAGPGPRDVDCDYKWFVDDCRAPSLVFSLNARMLNIS